MRLLDLFCGAGGAGMGYHHAGFDVVGVDINPQPNYPFEFHQGDAMTWPLDGFDVIHASPPCQRYSAAANIHDSAAQHPDLIPAARARLMSSGATWVMENVERSTLAATFCLCGSMFDLGVKRHRLFESNMLLLTPGCGRHDRWTASVFGGRTLGRQHVTHGPPGTRTQTWDKFDDELAAGGEAMGIDWMTMAELSEAIPPAYTEWIGARLLEQMERAA